jgi:hypothetical protein
MNQRHAQALSLVGLTAIECVALVSASSQIKNSLVSTMAAPQAMFAPPHALAQPAPHRAVRFGSVGMRWRRHMSMVPRRPGGVAGPGALDADAGNAAAAIPLLLPNLAAMIIAFRRGWVVDPGALADGEQEWKTFLAAREAPFPLTSPSLLSCNHAGSLSL